MAPTIPKPRGGHATPPKPRNLPRAWGPTPGFPHGAPNQGVSQRFKANPNTPPAGAGGKGPGAPKVLPGPAAPPPEDPIMTMFRSTLAEIRASAPPVDEALIRRPFNESGVVANQLGAGAAAADNTNSARVSDQYTKSSNEANAATAAAGIAAGAGPGTQQADNTQALLAQQNQAQQNASIGAGTAWAQLLNRLGTSAVSTATQNRQTGIDQASESLAASIPSMRQSADQLTLQRDSMESNNRYLLSSLNAKQRQFYRSDATTRRGQDVSRQNTVDSIAGAGERSQASIDAANSRAAKGVAAANLRNQRTIAGAQQRANTMAKKGTQGLAQAIKAITPGKVTDQRKIVGYYVTFPVDQTGILAGQAASPRTFVKDPATAQPPPGYLPLPAGTIGDPKYAPAGASKATGVTLAMWNKGVGALMIANGWNRAQATKAMKNLSPRPPK